MNKSRLIIACSLAVMALPMAAQTPTGGGNDFGTDLTIGVEKKLMPRLGLEIEGNYRTQDNGSETERFLVGATIGYKFHKDKKTELKYSVGYDFTWKNKLAETKEHFNSSGDMNGYNTTESYWRHRSRVSFAIGGGYSPTKRWQFSLKETMQYAHYLSGDPVDRMKYRYNDEDVLYLKETDQKAVKAKDKMLLRSKFGIEYNVKGIPLNPFATAEYITGSQHTERWKFTAGADYKYLKKHKFSLFYRFQKESDDDEPNGHIVGLGYKFSF